MITKSEIISKLEELKPELYRDYSIKKIGLFGSFSDNSYTKDSDIDILIKFKNTIEF